MNNNALKMIGIGIGPFNLSLAALLNKTDRIPFTFFDEKPHFDWHSEVMFPDSEMQTCYLKDLVTPVDPTSPYSFLNYLVRNGLFYSFMNAHRKVISRREFEIYCQWVCREMGESLQFGNRVESIEFKENRFLVHTQKGTYTSDHLSLATGPTPWIPPCATDFIGPSLFHAKSSFMRNLSLEGKNAVIVGGGQTGIEVFRNALKGKWGIPKNLKLITHRPNLEPLDETPFTNEYFTPPYVQDFLKLPQDKKEQIVYTQRLASDGNTPKYLAELYQDLYQHQLIQKESLSLQILANRKLEQVQRVGGEYKLSLVNEFMNRSETLIADAVILCTGFRNRIPKAIGPLLDRIPTDSEGRFIFEDGFAISWKGPSQNKIFALNFGRHYHGISEPQTSLMAWRAATIVNQLSSPQVFKTEPLVSNFIMN